MSQVPQTATLAQAIEEAQVPSPVESRDNWREETIRAGVLAALGRPQQLLRVSVRALWGDNYRVNVWTGENASATVPNSYFVTADERGMILRSEPPIQKQY